MKPRIALLLPCALFVACGGGANSPGPSAVTLSCADGALITAGAYRAQNNTWGKGALTGWSQCIGIGAGASDPVVGRWTWNWPNSGGNVKAYPEVIFGYKPAASPTTPQLPRRITDITELTVRYDFASSHSGSGNTAFDIWLTDTPLPSTFAVPPITHEVMVWLESYGAMTPGGAFIEAATIDGTAYEVFVADHFGSGGWRYIAFRRVMPQLGSATLNVKALLDYARSKSLVAGTEYVASVEFGNEIISGNGNSQLNSFAVSVK
jgi:hypothetical protein